MLNMVLAWMMVAIGGLAFAGFLFGFAAMLTLVERAIRQAQPLNLGIRPQVRVEPRLWA